MATYPVVLAAEGGRIAFDRPAQVRAGLLAAAFIAVFWELLVGLLSTLTWSLPPPGELLANQVRPE